MSMSKPWKLIYLGLFFLLPTKSNATTDVIRYPFESLGRFIEPASPSFGLHKLMSESNRRALYGLVASLLLSTPGVLMRNKTAALSLPLMALLGSSAYQYFNQNRALPPALESSNDEDTEQQRTEIEQVQQAMTSVQTVQPVQPGQISEVGSNDGSLGSQNQERIIDPDLLRIYQSKTPYDVLGVDADAELSAIKKEYYRLSNKFHSDKLTSQLRKQINDLWAADTKLQKPGNDPSKYFSGIITRAYVLLENKDVRKIYDEKGQDAALAALQQQSANLNDLITKEVQDYAPHIIAQGKNYMSIIRYFTLDKKIALTEIDKKFIEEEEKKTVKIVADLVSFSRQHGIEPRWDFKGGVIGLVESIKKELPRSDNRLQILEGWLGDLKKNGYVKESADRILDELFPSVADESSQREQEAGGMSDID